jgi:heat-inducible transcriptional repressor
MLEERRLAVLRAIVEDYVSTHEPVGSKALVERHNLGVSPATIRNDMAALEDEGFIAQPHTSAGRVPTDLGYRLFVDRLSGVKPLSNAERRAISQFLDESVDLDDVMTRTVRLLAQITKQVALVQYPSLGRSTVRHVELVSLSPTKVLVVIILDTGRVEQRVVDLPSSVGEQTLSDLRARILGSVAGRPFATVAEALADLGEEFADDRIAVQVIVSAVLEACTERVEERIVLGGTAHLARYGEAFPIAIQPVLEALEEQVVLMRLLGEASSAQTVTVRIGHENPVEGLEATSVITAQYSRGDTAVASLGVVGPTHMDYPGTMAAVHAVARYVSRILGEQ